MKKIYYIIFVLGLLSGVKSFAQLDTNFWFAIPDFDATHAEIPLRLIICPEVGAGGANVTIEVPANPGFSPLNIMVPVTECTVVDLTPFIADLETAPLNNVRNTGLHVFSSNRITTYFELSNLNEESSDFFSGKGYAAEGTTFIVPGQKNWEVSSGVYPNAGQGIVIVSTSDNNMVTITPSVNLKGGFIANTPFTIDLNEGETYAIQGFNGSLSYDLGGTEISSTQNITITKFTEAGEFSPYGNCKDLLGDQIVPTWALDNEYILVKGSLGEYANTYACTAGSKKGGKVLLPNVQFPDQVFITGVYNGTTITVDGGTIYSLNKGQTIAIELVLHSMHILSTAPIYVYQGTGNGCEAAASMVPPLRCTGMNQAYMYRNTDEDMYLMLIVPAGAENGFRINGNSALAQSNDFDPVPGTNGTWMAGMVKLGIKGANAVKGGQTSFIENYQSKYRMGILHGCALNTASFTYLADYYEVKLNPIYHVK